MTNFVFNHTGDSAAAVERVLQTGYGTTGTYSDVFQLVEDPKFRPSTSLFTGIYSLDSTAASPTLLGLSNVIFSWDTVLLDTLPSNLERVDCVLITPTMTVTMSVDHGTATTVGRGDFHDPSMTSYGLSVVLDINSASGTTGNPLYGDKFTIMIYPSSAFHDQYITQVPLQLGIGVGVCAFFILIMLYAMAMLQQQMQKEKETALHALLDAKKSYVRYISHGNNTTISTHILYYHTPILIHNTYPILIKNRIAHTIECRYVRAQYGSDPNGTKQKSHSGRSRNV